MSLIDLRLARRAREAFDLDVPAPADDALSPAADRLIARRWALSINSARPGRPPLLAAEITVLALIQDCQRQIIKYYRDETGPLCLAGALDALARSRGSEAAEVLLRRVIEEFPPAAAVKAGFDPWSYLDGTVDGVPARETELETAWLVRLANLNPALAPLHDLIDDAPLAAARAYPESLEEARGYFRTQPPLGATGESLIDFLGGPAAASPDSMAGQLAFMAERGAPYLGRTLGGLLRALDFLREESKATFAGPGPARVPAFGPDSQSGSLGLFGSRGPGEPEPERFSADLDWMPQLVLMAKNTYVWLDQLSRRHSRPIQRLDQIPDQELDGLRQAGISGLWLIGLWERSRASRRIKQMMGNPEAVASAYSLYDYQIAEDLGGEAALWDLKGRAAARGIRLASDMVPNHMGIDSRWVMEHPDWFIGLDEPPFPAYRFSGPDLSEDERAGIQVEDRYFDRADAAVVFKRWDRRTGQARYIYHGNDGTSFPWNDTAQLDYLKPEVREAVIGQILEVARRFPVIRFDAAMTLARRHLQRLWYPEPGQGGAIPSRAEHGLSREAFEAAVPEEFWRQVVDRVAAEAPGTLLLAEAFWLMEGYFVRTLGMHRVYNSAFMHMLRDEDNAKYRRVIKNTLEFDPEVLKRYVNFMNNPDERTASDQFGDGDKYFGVCTLLATLPGLPMVGHGQIEGFREKYGMEYRRAYQDEPAKPWLLEGHDRRIFPLFHMRRLFAEAASFLLYDFYRPEGGVDENVFAYSNRAGGERSLVVYHNKYAETSGWIRTAAAYAAKVGSGDSKVLVHKTLGEGLAIGGDPSSWVVFRDHVSGLELLRNSRELCEKGLFLELHAYECRVFLDFREIPDDARGLLGRLAAELRGGGVPSLDAALRELRSRAARLAFLSLLEPASEDESAARGGPDEETMGRIEAKALALVRAINESSAPDVLNEAAFVRDVRRRFASVLGQPSGSGPGWDATAPSSSPIGARLARASLLGWAVMKALSPARAAEFGLDAALAESWREAAGDELKARQAVHAVKGLAGPEAVIGPDEPAGRAASRIAARLASDPDLRASLLVNEYQGVEYFHQESFDRLLWWIETTAAAEAETAGTAIAKTVDLLRAAADRSGFRLARLAAGLTAR